MQGDKLCVILGEVSDPLEASKFEIAYASLSA